MARNENTREKRFVYDFRNLTVLANADREFKVTGK